MKVNKYILLLTGLLLSGDIFAQFNPYDVYSYSRSNSAYLSARVAAMGGAFTSLGGDPSSIIVNPAGLGLYRSSEVSLTPSIKISSVNSISELPDPNPISTNASKGYFGLNNFNYIQNIFNTHQGIFRGLTIGIGYNKENVSSQFSKSVSSASEVSIIDMFSGMLSAENIAPNALLAEDAYMKTNASLWRAVSGFRNGSMAVSDNAPWSYIPDQLSFYAGDKFIQGQKDYIIGKTENYDLSWGLNLIDKIHIGMSLGISQYAYKSATNYTENALKTNRGDYNSMSDWQDRYISATAFDFKVGAIIEPVPGFRIGASYNLAKRTYANNEYATDQTITYLGDPKDYYSESPINSRRDRMKGADQLSLGTSLVIRGLGVISFDWNRIWYNHMTINNNYFSPNENGLMNQNIAMTYKPADNFKAGIEVYVGAGFYIRGGYAHLGSAWRSSQNGYDDSIRNISAGLGFKTKAFYLDLAYINSHSKTQPYGYFGSNNFQSESIIYPKNNDNIISMTLGIRF